MPSYEGGGSGDGIAWDLAFTQQQAVHRAGASLEERLNLFGNALADVAANLEKKIGYDKWEAHEAKKEVDSLIVLLDGTGGTGGLRRLYKKSMDLNPYAYDSKADVEIALDSAWRRLKKLISKHNLTSQGIMQLVNAGRVTEVRMKPGAGE